MINNYTISSTEKFQISDINFNKDGLVPVISQCVHTGVILMMAWMNKESIIKTLETGEVHYWSRSRKQVWHKGKTSGFIQKVKEVRIDDDQDSVWLSVDIGNGSSCHVGYRSCFYRSIPLGKIENAKEIKMKFEEKEKKFDPKKVYKDQPNPTKI